MAQPVSYKKAPNDGDVLLEMVEPSFHAKGSEPKGMYLEDAGPNKKIDYVLVYERCQEKENKDEEAKEKAEKLEDMRRSFEASLESAGLVIERKDHPLPQDPKTKRHFVLIHAPWEVLSSKAESMRLKVPFQENDILIKSWMEKNLGTDTMKSLRQRNPLIVHDSTVKDKGNFFMTNFTRENVTKFVDHQNKETFFGNVDRVYIVQQICGSARFAEGNDAAQGD